ncbi:MAG: geranylgeranyl reductase family protein [Acidimicrobiales bacterium]
MTDRAALQPPRPAVRSCDVLVVGAGPSGSAAAYWLATQGLDVVAVEAKHFPRAKTCGDGLTPRSVRQLADMGLEPHLAANHHRYEGLRSVAFGRSLEMTWPDHPGFPSYGYTVTRFDLDALVAHNAEKAGAELWQGAEAVAPLTSRADPRPLPAGPGPAGGAVILDRDRQTTSEVRARCVVIADGSLTRFGRSLGTSRVKAWPQGMAIRGYFASPRHEDAFIESHLDIRDADGSVVPGYGWIFPLGDGRVNVGIGLLSTSDRWKGANTTKLMDQFVSFAPKSWCLSPATALGAPTGGRLPMGFAVGPRVGPDWVVVGDAAGSINPFNGEGIAYGYETGRIAAETIGQVLGRAASLDDLSAYEDRLQDEYGRYYAVARSFVKVIGNPQLMRACVGAGMYVTPVMRWVLRIMANLTRPELAGPPEAIYRSAAALSETIERRRLQRSA